MRNWKACFVVDTIRHCSSEYTHGEETESESEVAEPGDTL